VARSRIHILATGGTIAGAADPASNGARYTAGVRSVASLLAAVPGLADVADISAEQILALDSKDITPADWLVIRTAALRSLADPAIDGIVILHGTDTMEETAYFLHLSLPPGKAVVLTGAMRPADHPQADGPANLLAALRLAAQDAARGKGVLVVMNETAHAARWLGKARTTGLDAFESSRPWHDARPDSSFHTVDVSALPRVNILPGYAGAPAELIDACVAAGARGLVLALTGHGSIPGAWLPALHRAKEGGVAILRASRCTGPVSRNANADDDGEGWLTAGDLPPAKARIALMLALAAGWPDDALRTRLPGL
jgi:L-asparaginase